MTIPNRQIRANYDDSTITVYQAYSPTIAEPAVAAGRFVPPFKAGRMTWIKPSFLWMMYRCGWATKPDQERVLAVRVSREGFEKALSQASLSHFDPDVDSSHDAWSAKKTESPVRVQWDPERTVELAPLPHRSLQVGLGGSAAQRYVDEWIVGLDDITSTAKRIGDLVAAKDLDAARSLLPTERPYGLPSEIAARIGASS